jgi:hypothetical protein
LASIVIAGGARKDGPVALSARMSAPRLKKFLTNMQGYVYNGGYIIAKAKLHIFNFLCLATNACAALVQAGINYFKGVV